MSENWGEIGIGLAAMGIYQVRAGVLEGTEYQRQQLNLLRKHQGLPPIPPEYRPPDHFVGLWVGTTALWTVLFVVPFFFGEYTGYHLLFTLISGGWAFVRLCVWFAHQDEIAEDRFYDRWERAGCP